MLPYIENNEHISFLSSLLYNNHQHSGSGIVCALYQDRFNVWPNDDYLEYLLIFLQGLTFGEGFKHFWVAFHEWKRHNRMNPLSLRENVFHCKTFFVKDFDEDMTIADIIPSSCVTKIKFQYPRHRTGSGSST